MDPAEIKKLKNKIHMLRALLLIRNGKVSGKIYHVAYDSDSKHWAITLEGAKKIVTKIKDKNKAIQTGKDLAKKAYIGQVYIYNKDGTPQKAYTFVDEVRKEKERTRKRLERERRAARRRSWWW